MSRGTGVRALCVIGVIGLGVFIAPSRCPGTTPAAKETDQDLSKETLAQLDQMDVALDAATLFLQPGEIRNFPANNITRVAIGNPDIVDVSIVSANEVLLQAKKAGHTNLILWDSQGAKRSSVVNVVDPKSDEREDMLRQAIADMGLEGLQLKRDGDTLLVMGQAQTQEDFDRLQRLLDSVEGAHNLVTVRKAAPPPSDPLIKLTVQLIEINRRELENIGVKWDQSITFVHPATSDQTFAEALLDRWGTGVSRSQLQITLAALLQKNQARLLAEPKLVTVSGKEAETFVGVDVPVIEGTSSGGTGVVTTSIGFRNTGITLKMTPTLRADHRISTVVTAEASDVDNSVALSLPVAGSTVAIPGFQVRRASTEVTTNPGETVLIAGLLKTEDSNEVNQVPGLGSAPVIGRLCRSPKTESKQRELIIAMTPELLADAQLGADNSLAMEQALARTQVTTAVSDPVLRYALQVQDRIAAALHYPAAGRSVAPKGQVVLRLHIFRDGRLAEAAVARPSGIESFDRAALDAAKSQAPYTVFPPDLIQPELWLELPVVFGP